MEIIWQEQVPRLVSALPTVNMHAYKNNATGMFANNVSVAVEESRNSSLCLSSSFFSLSSGHRTQTSETSTECKQNLGKERGNRYLITYLKSRIQIFLRAVNIQISQDHKPLRLFLCLTCTIWNWIFVISNHKYQ